MNKHELAEKFYGMKLKFSSYEKGAVSFIGEKDGYTIQAGYIDESCKVGSDSEIEFCAFAENFNFVDVLNSDGENVFSYFDI